MLGTLSVRRRLFEQEEARRRRYEERWGCRARFRWLDDSLWTNAPFV